ncbi:permease [Streptomyces sp. ISL-1]|uniref:DUF6228 family protein n=1 Tax=Streptomyces sp. ISL-1 TaxID=2817657 RepID=UPI001BE71D4E|nr:DUF6228 family protein [Streptomyces sp. ISL-1]MBT2393290.1 permease [Streptomyces sp. ISL-1]
MSLIEVVPGQVELVVRGAGSQAPSIRLFDWSRTDEFEVVFAVEAVDDGLRARIEAVTMSAWDGAGYLTEFLDGLARDFRGWEGERSWTNNELVVAATFGSGGHVHLSWTLRAGVFSSGWECTVTTVIEAGEELTAVAADVQEFFRQG